MRISTLTLDDGFADRGPRFWQLWRNHPFWTCSIFAISATLSGLCIFYEVTFLLAVVPAALLSVSVYNLLALTTRLYDDGRPLLGHLMALWSLGGAMSLIPTFFYLFLSWLFVPL